MQAEWAMTAAQTRISASPSRAIFACAVVLLLTIIAILPL
jgi:hypothetical protein